MSRPARWQPEACNGEAGIVAARFAIGLNRVQAHLVAEALGQRPYAEVHALIGRLRAGAVPAGTAPLVLDHAELALILAALAELPYRRVHVLVDSLRRQLAAAGAVLREAA